MEPSAAAATSPVASASRAVVADRGELAGGVLGRRASPLRPVAVDERSGKLPVTNDGEGTRAMTPPASLDAAPAFATRLTLAGPPRAPRQLLDDQTYGGHASLHDAETAGSLGLAGAPIEGPTHFSQFDPLAFAAFGQAWFETGCVSAHFSTMVVEGEEVTASLTPTGAGAARIEATKGDHSRVLTGTATVAASAETELEGRLAKLGSPGELFIVDQLALGQRSAAPATVQVDLETANGELYPFSLAEKLAAITEPSGWYLTGDNPWGRPILPFEMISVLAQKSGSDLAVRGPAIGLFLDLEIRLAGGPLFVGQDYVVEREVVGLSESRRTESYWVRSDLTDAATGAPAASVLLHSGVFKASFAGYPQDRL